MVINFQNWNNMKSKILIFGAVYLLAFTLGCVQQPVEKTITTIQTTSTVSIQSSLCHIHIEEFTSREKPEYYVFEGINQKEVILNAINEIKKNSKRDYDMVCRYGNKILIRPDEIVLKKCSVQGTPSEACYDQKEKAIYLSYRPLLNPKRLPSILVHESCHGMELETTGHTSEGSCIKREMLYKASSEKKSFYCEKEIVTSSYYHDKGHIWHIKGVCTFINDENKDRTICVVVYSKDGEKVVNQTKVCSYTPAGKTSKKKFYISSRSNSLEFREVTKDTETSTQTTSTVETIHVVSTALDVSGCERIDNQESRYMCYYAVAKVQDNPAICEKISDQNLLYCCKAVTKKDPDICEMIEDQENKYWCYSRVAIVKKDQSICEKIKSQEGRDHCYQDVAKSRLT